VNAAAPVVPAPVPVRPEDAPPLPRGHVHLWHADLDALASDESLLDEAELLRAGLMIPRVRHRFTASRRLVRRIVGRYAAEDPASLRFETVGEGKPRLAAFHPTRPRFNLSHADGRWLLAVSTVEVGVDVERGDRDVDIERVARRIFRPGEAEAILREHGYARRRAFFRAWTGREALVKARAEGMFTLSLPAEIRLAPSEPLALHGAGAGTWTLFEVPETFPWCAAVAMEERPAGVAAFRVA
jgi:4'-phosphopantetheinyl transferase